MNNQKNKLISSGIWLLFIVLSLVWNSCSKTDPTDCFTATGPDVTQKRSAAAFRRIILHDNVNLVLTQDSSYSVVVKAGEKIISKIKTNIKDGTLEIFNENTCNWVRDFEREITVYAHINILNDIEYRGSGDITATNLIKQDSLMLNVWEGAGKIELEIDNYRNYIYFHIGTADIHYRGKAHLNYLSVMSFGPVYAHNLRTKFTYLTAGGSNNSYVNASVELHAHLSSIGNVYYAGQPQIFVNQTSTGKLLPIE